MRMSSELGNVKFGVCPQTNLLYPIECKRSATLDRTAARHFHRLANFGMPVGRGAVISLFPERVPISPGVDAIPAYGI